MSCCDQSKCIEFCKKGVVCMKGISASAVLFSLVF